MPYIEALLKWNTNKKNFSFQTGLRSCGTVFVLFLVFPTWTVTYGSLVPVLSFPIRPCAQITEKRNVTR